MVTPDDDFFNPDEIFEQAEDYFYGTDFNETEYAGPDFEARLAELSAEAPTGGEIGAFDPGQVNSLDPVGPEASSNGSITMGLPNAKYLDGMDMNMAHPQFQQPEPLGYMGTANLFDGGIPNQSGLGQDTQSCSVVPPVPPKGLSGIIIPRKSPPLPLDVGKTAYCYGDYYYYDSDISLPLGNPPLANSPVERKIVEKPMNSEPAHTLKRRGSTDLVQGKIKRNTRRKRGGPDDARFLSEQYYGQPPPPKGAWGPRQKDGMLLFSYNRQGELARGRPFELKEMKWYLFAKSPGGCENWVERKTEPGEVQREGKVRSGLTLWVGWTPAQANDRYPSSNSNKCKFLDCAISNRTIRTGEPRVILDERHNVNGAVIDPFYNAGYCHLYCLEKHFGMEHLMDVLDVRFDNRYFAKEEVNLCALKTDEEQACLKWANDFWEDYCHWRCDEYSPARDDRDKARRARSTSPEVALPPAAPERLRLWSDSLTYRLICKSLKLETRAKANQRIKRREVKPDSCDRDTHKGDLDFANQAREKKRSKVSGPLKVGEAWDLFQHAKREHLEKPGSVHRKRRRCDDPETEEADGLHRAKRHQSAPPDIRPHQNSSMASFNAYPTPILHDSTAGMLMASYGYSAEGQYMGPYVYDVGDAGPSQPPEMASVPPFAGTQDPEATVIKQEGEDPSVVDIPCDPSYGLCLDDMEAVMSFGKLD
ncbi:hypothetical protein PG999_005780 [Apiospora kogelbergensis]|uniref:Uncharacterized protein n=2 Tax=Apiospora kogelbergensis TaxID=1337665 RepID=A0AAW0QQD8_9PEZI